MLAVRHRLVDGRDFRATTRSGAHAGGASVVVHVRPRTDAGPGRAGLVVGKTVGNAVARTRLKRRLRHLLAARTALWDGLDVVVRARPEASATSSARLGADLDRCLRRAVDRLAPTGKAESPR